MCVVTRKLRETISRQVSGGLSKRDENLLIFKNLKYRGGTDPHRQFVSDYVRLIFIISRERRLTLLRVSTRHKRGLDKIP